ncbi:MAG TPA: hypothetical protein VGV60_01940 [Candidatus Polarisedimenticolia bacterium]|jgi:hypothetical protein|nr:hypothetical protein [Candidatus Polarisedimenticolia bacterium]
MVKLKVKLTPAQGGSQFEVKNVTDLRWGFGRPPGPGGHLGMDGFDIDTLLLSRIKSMPDENGKTQREDETVRAAAALGQRATLKGEITVAPANEPTNIIQTIRWDNGFISGLRTAVHGHEMREEIEVTVTGLKVGDYNIPRYNTERV